MAINQGGFFNLEWENKEFENIPEMKQMF